MFKLLVGHVVVALFTSKYEAYQAMNHMISKGYKCSIKGG